MRNYLQPRMLRNIAGKPSGHVYPPQHPNPFVGDELGRFSMSTVLFTWELGAGLGHVTVLRPLVERLLDHGHRVVVAMKDLHRGHQLVENRDVTYFQAPIQTRAIQNPIEHPSTFAHVLHNAGFGDKKTLGVTAEAWRSIYRHVRPDLVVFDHSPTALLASRCFDVKRVVVGNGFCCPADGSPMPDWRPWMKRDPAQLHREEGAVLRTVNQQLRAWRAQYLRRLSDLYTQADVTALATVSELDHFGPRNEPCYFGVWSHGSGKAPEWPIGGTGKRVYAYVRPFAGMHALFRILRHWRVPTVVFADGID